MNVIYEEDDPTVEHEPVVVAHTTTCRECGLRMQVPVLVTGKRRPSIRVNHEGKGHSVVAAA